jgi:hypothetical protein
MADCGAADSFCGGISGVNRRASFAVVWGPPGGRRALQCAANRI